MSQQFIDRTRTITCHDCTVQDKEKFISHMTAGVQLSLEPAEEAIIAKTDELIESQVSDVIIATCAPIYKYKRLENSVYVGTSVLCQFN